MIAMALAAALAASSGDAFARYAVRVQSVPAHVSIERRTPWSRRYRSELARQAKERVDFAGRYVLAEIGCGAECLSVGAIDRLTGHVVELAPTVCCWPDAVTLPLQHRADSRLLVVQGRLDEAGDVGPHRFVLSRGAFRRLADDDAASGR